MDCTGFEPAFSVLHSATFPFMLTAQYKLDQDYTWIFFTKKKLKMSCTGLEPVSTDLQSVAFPVMLTAQYTIHQNFTWIKKN
jgi:hypothetical protein